MKYSTNLGYKYDLFAFTFNCFTYHFLINKNMISSLKNHILLKSPKHRVFLPCLRKQRYESLGYYLSPISTLFTITKQCLKLIQNNINDNADAIWPWQVIHAVHISSCQQQFLKWGWSRKNKGQRRKWRMELWATEKHLLLKGQIENSKTKPASNSSHLFLVIIPTIITFPVTEDKLW